MLLRAIDFETTGVAPPAAVIEVGLCDVTQTPAEWRPAPPISALHGGAVITPETRAIHHISPHEIVGLPPFSAEDVIRQAAVDGVTAMVAHHADFEAQWLRPLPPELALICTYKCALRCWPDLPSHSNQFLRYHLPETGMTEPDASLCQPAHRAGPDAYATAWTVSALLKCASLHDLITWTKGPAVMPRIPIGKQRGAKWPDVEEGFLRWMLRQADMADDLRWNAQRELARRAG